MLVGGRDKRINHLETEIKKKKEFLLLKSKELEQDVNNNKYLEGISENYKNFYDTVIKEKQQQHDAMMLLKEYLNDLIDTLKSMEPKPFNHDHIFFILLVLILPISGFTAYALTKKKKPVEKDEIS
jgi:uncharacterized protein YpmB